MSTQDQPLDHVPEHNKHRVEERHVVWLDGPSKSGKSSMLSALIQLPAFIDMAITDEQEVMLPVHFRNKPHRSWTFSLVFKEQEAWANQEGQLALGLYGGVQMLLEQHEDCNVQELFEVLNDRKDSPMYLYGTLRKSLRDVLMSEMIFDAMDVLWSIRPDTMDAKEDMIAFVQGGRVPKWLHTHRSTKLWNKQIDFDDLNELELNLLIYLFTKHHSSELDVNMCLLIVNAMVSPSMTVNLAINLWQVYIQNYIKKHKCTCTSGNTRMLATSPSLYAQQAYGSSTSQCECQLGVAATTDLMRMRLANAIQLVEKCPHLKIAIHHHCFVNLLNFWPVLDHVVIRGPVQLSSQVTLIDMPSSNPLIKSLCYDIIQESHPKRNKAQHYLWYCHQSSSNHTNLKEFYTIKQYFDQNHVRLLMTHTVHPCLRHLIEKEVENLEAVRQDAKLSTMVLVADLIKSLDKEQQSHAISELVDVYIHAVSSLSHRLGEYAKYCQVARSDETHPKYASVRLYHHALRDLENPTAEAIEAKLHAQPDEELRQYQLDMFNAAGVNELKSMLWHPRLLIDPPL